MRTWAILVTAAAAGIAGGILLGPGPLDRFVPEAGDHGAWYASRAAGVTSYLLIWLSLFGGLLMSSAWFDGVIGRARLLAVHQTAAVAGVALALAHGLVLIPDGWTDFGLIDVLVPFASYYETTVTAMGTLSLYLLTVVSASFWFRSAIGPRMWRAVHYAAFVGFVGALWHGLKVGSDSREPWLLSLYLLTSFSVVFAIVVRTTYVRVPNRMRREDRAAA